MRWWSAKAILTTANDDSLRKLGFNYKLDNAKGHCPEFGVGSRKRIQDFLDTFVACHLNESRKLLLGLRSENVIGDFFSVRKMAV